MDAPAQSETARRAGLVPAPAVTFANVGNRDSIHEKKRISERYLEVVKKRTQYGHRGVDELDEREATNNDVGCQEGFMIPALGGALPPVVVNEIVQILNLENGPWIQRS